MLQSEVTACPFSTKLFLILNFLVQDLSYLVVKNFRLCCLVIFLSPSRPVFPKQGSAGNFEKNKNENF
jgi:hypothetical protein